MKSLFLSVALCTFYSFLFSQKLTVVNLEELRSISGSWDYCKIEVKPIGDEIRNYTYYKVDEIKRAVDNKGISLLPENQSESGYKPVNENITLQLLKASRSATSITVDGTISLYKPTEANGGIVKLSGFMKRTEVNLAPKGSAFTVFYYDKATLAKKNEVDYMKRYEEIEKLPESERSFATEVSSLVSGLTYYSDEDLKKILFFAVGGDNSAILGFEFEDGKGKKISPVSTSSTSVVYTYYFDEIPDPSMKVILNVESIKSVKKIPFSLLGIDLP